MSSQLIICLVIFVLTCAGYMTGVWSLATVSMLSVSALILTGCMDAKTALTYFGNSTPLMIGAMSVVAAGFNRTAFCANLSKGIAKISNGSLVKMMLGYCLLSALLSSMIQSPVVVFGIVAPLCMASAESMGLSKSKISLPLAVTAISTCCVLPIGQGATQAAELNGYISSYYSGLEGFTGTMPEVAFLNPMMARGPLAIISIVFCALVMHKFCPDQPPVVTEESMKKSESAAKALPAFQEWAGIIIFFGTALALCLQASILSSVATWVICLVGAVLMVVTGVLKPKDATKSVPWSMLLLIVGSLAMAGCLSSTGAGQLIGNAIAVVVNGMGGNSYLVGLLFFIVPFILTQFMSNRGTMLIFIPIAIATCYAVGGSCVGLIILIQQACLTAFMTPMATGAVPYMMEYGGYDQASILKGGWLYAVVMMAASVLWIMTIFPIL